MDNLIREIEAALATYERAAAAFLKPDTEIDSAAYFEVRDYLEGRAPEWLRALLDENARLRQVVEAAREIEGLLPTTRDFIGNETMTANVAWNAAIAGDKLRAALQAGEGDTPAE